MSYIFFYSPLNTVVVWHDLCVGLSDALPLDRRRHVVLKKKSHKKVQFLRFVKSLKFLVLKSTEISTKKVNIALQISWIKEHGAAAYRAEISRLL